jgi:hypothetical protein
VYLTRILIVAGLVLAGAGATAETTYILSDIPFNEHTNVPDKVRAECNLGPKTAQFIKQYGKDVEFTETLGTGRYIDMSITEVHSPGGGSWSGPKWMEVTGTLMQGDQKVAGFRAQRYSTGGAFGGFKGTCSIIGRTTKAIGKDIGNWLKDPRDGAALGDAQ